MRNTLAWTESVHGYCHATDGAQKTFYRELCREMVESELANARELLALWETSRIDFMPVSTMGETLHSYATNFGMLLRKKIELMELHGNGEPAVDENYMWRLNEHVPHH